ncbi:MAG: hypothetical protein KDA24_13160 [Deltaproteobacteria bacterium]|nr:hypothetical protein [Deltaproteobacteria bacterium]
MSHPRPFASLRVLFCILAAALTLPSGLDAATRAGSIEFTGTADGDRSLRSTESRILRAGPAAASQIVSRTGVHLFVVDNETTWNDYVADGLAEALMDGPRAVASFAEGLPSDIAQAGPDVEGGVMRFVLPGKRGEGLIAVYFPDLLDRSRDSLDRLNATVPNEGLYVSGVSVKRDKSGDSDFVGMYLPSRPKGLTRGRVPDVNVRELPRDGRGDLAIWRGKGASGDDAEKHRASLSRLLDADRIAASDLRDFPKGKDDLVRSLRTSRSDQEVLRFEGAPYGTLAAGPESWETETQKSVHPSRYVAFSAPVALEGEDGERMGTVILGGVAFYTPLMLEPEEARRYVNKSAYAFYGSVHRGELQFFRDGDEVLFFRGHLDEWRDGKGRQRRGRAWRTKAGPERIKELAAESGSRRLNKARGAVLPMRFETIPAEELRDRPDDRPPVRGRLYDGDLVGWLRHYDRKAELEGGPAVHATKSAAGGARFDASFSRDGPVVEETTARSGSGPLLEVVDVYTMHSSCTPGEQVVGVVEFVVDRIPDGEEAALKLEWSISSGGPALARLSASLLREAGEHEVLFEAGCPSDGGSGELGVILSWEATGLRVDGSAKVSVSR